jgi:hypothetical protein
MKSTRRILSAAVLAVLLVPIAAFATTYRATLSCTSGFTGVRITSVEFWCSEAPCAAAPCPVHGTSICPGLVAAFGTGNLSCANVLDTDKVRDFVTSDACGYQAKCGQMTAYCRRWVRVSYICSLYPGVIKSVCMRVPGSVSLTCTPAAAEKVADDPGATLTFQELLPEAVVASDCLPPPRPLAAQSSVSFAGGAITLSQLQILGLGPCVLPPAAPGVPAFFPVNGVLSGAISFGGAPLPFSAPLSGNIRTEFASMGAGIRFFDTEMLTLDLLGAPLPGFVLLRESPTLSSLGMTTLRASSGAWWTSSFFDVFFEISTDGGLTWLPSTGAGGNPSAVRLLLRREPTDVASVVAPKSTVLYPCVPNPFNPTTTIEFDLAREGLVQLRILDVMGRVVRNLVHESMTEGRHVLVWNGTDAAGNRLPSGVYTYQFVAGDVRATRKMVLVK